MVHFDEEHRAVHYPSDRRFRLWIRPSILIGICCTILGVIVAAWIEVAIAGMPAVPPVPQISPNNFSGPHGFPVWARYCHFFNFLFVMLLIRSGLSILVDHPRLYFNDGCTPGSEWIRFTPLRVPRDRLWTAKDDARYISPIVGTPGYRHTIGIARAWHFINVHGFIITGVLFIGSTSLVCQACKHQFNPQDGRASGQHITSASGQKHRIKDLLPADGSPLPHRLYAIMALRPSGEKIYLKPGPEDLTLYAEAETRLATESLPLPTLAVRSGHKTDQARGYNFHHWRDFFNARQLLCLGLLLREILRLEDRTVQEQMLCLFSSTLEFNNLFCSFKGEGTGAVRHMFSNHILKPERTPLENSVWGTDKSSGTFCSLFESRLIRAKRYLDEPFEVTLDADLLGNKAQARKIVASDTIDVHQVGSWDELGKMGQGALILSGDSSHLPIPDKSVDAVITDPPYFDFVHYSELSDFFFAWLSPVLRQRYAWFDRPDCSDSGEVQHKDPRTFARQLSYVLSECQRVLQDDGVLAFSFHHSRAEGWAAIYEAITAAGLGVVAAQKNALAQFWEAKRQTENRNLSNAAFAISDTPLLLACWKPASLIRLWRALWDGPPRQPSACPSVTGTLEIRLSALRSRCWEEWKFPWDPSKNPPTRRRLKMELFSKRLKKNGSSGRIRIIN